MKNRFLFLLLSLYYTLPGYTQEDKLLTEKQGTFKTRYNLSNGMGADSYGKKSIFTTTELEASKKNHDRLVDTFRRVPVLASNKGFDAYAYIQNGILNTKFGYGVPVTVGFFFETWLLRHGKETKHTVEPPQFRLQTNSIEEFCSQGFNVSNERDGYNPTNPDFKPAAMDKAAVELRELFFLPGVRNQVSAGIDRYGDYYILYNPDRPVYWKQVTIREVYRRIINYWKVHPDKGQSTTMVPMVEKLFSGYSEAEKDGFAYRGSHDIIHKIGSAKNEFPVMIPNADYWNRSLPRSAIQFLMIEIPDDATLKKKMEKSLKGASGYYYVYKLFTELDLNNLLPIIYQ